MHYTRQCSIDDCTRSDIQGHDMCALHYMRWYRTGRTTARPIRAQRGMCVVEECGQLDDGPHGYCPKHDARRRRNGDPLRLKGPKVMSAEANWRWTGDEASYQAMHQRVRIKRGRASSHACVDCGSAAKHWSYDRTDTDERQSIEGPYSVDVEHYDPRCVPCHKKFDLEALNGT